MGDGEAAGVNVGVKRLDVLEGGLAGRRVAVVADGHVALEAMDDARIVEVVADEAEVALGVELVAVVGDDAGRFLTAVLQGVQAECGEGRRIRVPKNTKDPAFLAESVVAHPGKAEIRKGVALFERPVVRHGCLPLKHPPQLRYAIRGNMRAARRGRHTPPLPARNI